MRVRGCQSGRQKGWETAAPPSHGRCYLETKDSCISVSCLRAATCMLCCRVSVASLKWSWRSEGCCPSAELADTTATPLLAPPAGERGVAKPHEHTRGDMICALPPKAAAWYMALMAFPSPFIFSEGVVAATEGKPVRKVSACRAVVRFALYPPHIIPRNFPTLTRHSSAKSHPHRYHTCTRTHAPTQTPPIRILHSIAHALFYCHNNRTTMSSSDVHFRVAEELVERAISGGLERLASERGGKMVAWPSSEGFTVEKGQQAIENTVKVCTVLYVQNN